MRRTAKRNTVDWLVMAKQCSTCVLRTDAQGRYIDPHIAKTVTDRCLTEASQICHHPALHGKRETHLCRGTRDYQINFFYRIGFLDAPTDEAWNRKRQQLGI